MVPKLSRTVYIQLVVCVYLGVKQRKYFCSALIIVLFWCSVSRWDAPHQHQRIRTYVPLDKTQRTEMRHKLHQNSPQLLEPMITCWHHHKLMFFHVMFQRNPHFIYLKYFLVCSLLFWFSCASMCKTRQICNLCHLEYTWLFIFCSLSGPIWNTNYPNRCLFACWHLLNW